MFTTEGEAAGCRKATKMRGQRALGRVSHRASLLTSTSLTKIHIKLTILVGALWHLPIRLGCHNKSCNPLGTSETFH